jgi:hypothetical protein
MSEFKAGDRVRMVKHENGKDMANGPVGTVERVSDVGGNHCHIWFDGSTRLLGSCAVRYEHLAHE